MLHTHYFPHLSVVIYYAQLSRGLWTMVDCCCHSHKGQFKKNRSQEFGGPLKSAALFSRTLRISLLHVHQVIWIRLSDQRGFYCFPKQLEEEQRVYYPGIWFCKRSTLWTICCLLLWVGMSSCHVAVAVKLIA